jgi:hypothetical protein
MGLSGGTDEATEWQRNVGTSKILARYKGSTISLQAAVHLGHMPRALTKKKKKKKKNWNLYNGMIFELEGDLDRYHFFLTIA